MGSVKKLYLGNYKSIVKNDHYVNNVILTGAKTFLPKMYKNWDLTDTKNEYLVKC